MSKRLTITVYPSTLGSEFLSVEDALRQVLDLVESVVAANANGGGKNVVIWRLTEAHTNSPPFTVEATAFALDATASIAAEASHMVHAFSTALSALMSGRRPARFEVEAAQHLRRVFDRNLNGVGETLVSPEGEPEIRITRADALRAKNTLDQILAESQIDDVDLQRTEYGSAEGEVVGLTRWHDRPAILLKERLSGDRVTCVLSNALADDLGPGHAWSEAWDGRRVLIGGALQYASDGRLKRIDADRMSEMSWTDVPLSKLRTINILNGRTAREHVEQFWGKDGGKA
ncbi:hypothetical protein [Aurantimonas sp. 22II-16-19i]|uniref:hypothetical protein n=1 Tax=Aurantimonas sp. 22II-16-19i TaxID=1317114 RepID=UPI0009F7F4DD|nr:hypothetical protein [Aurantimonas sp. 22II-16-19i]ORE97464.1 hypothetical protein ATO4_09097 [Aurantimonas sp. 22II-16-19i]